MRRLAAIILPVCVLLPCAGCGGRPKIDRLTPGSIVVAFGDSLTAGTGASASENYPAVLSQIIGCRVMNAGVAGEDTTEARRRLPAVLKRDRPDMVIICHGGNDLLRSQDLATVRENLDAMIGMTRDAGADVVLIGVPQPGLVLKVPPLYRDLARLHAIPFLPDVLPQILSTPSLKSDQVHPNAAGYRKLAESVAAVIQTIQSAKNIEH